MLCAARNQAPPRIAEPGSDREEVAWNRNKKTDALKDARLQCYGGEARIRTGGKGFAGLCLTTWPLRRICKGPIEIGPGTFNGADNGARTRDPNLGKVVLYQLSHVRLRKSTIRNRSFKRKAPFENNGNWFSGRLSSEGEDRLWTLGCGLRIRQHDAMRSAKRQEIGRF